MIDEIILFDKEIAWSDIDASFACDIPVSQRVITGEISVRGYGGNMEKEKISFYATAALSHLQLDGD